MKNWNKTIRIMLLRLLCVVTAALMPGQTGKAASKAPTCAKTQTVYLLEGEEKGTYVMGPGCHIIIRNVDWDAKITGIKSSNKNVGATTRGPGAVNDMVALYGNGNLKPGATSKITFQVKQNKKTYSLSCKVTFIKDTRQYFKKLEIDGKNYAAKTKGKSYLALTLPKNKRVKISVKGDASKNAVSGTTYYCMALYRCFDGEYRYTILKNGGKVKLKEGDILSVSYGVGEYILGSKDYTGDMKILVK